MKNEIKVIFGTDSANEQFARMVISAFTMRLDPTLEELADMKTAVSEAVTNSIIHGYEEQDGIIEMRCRIEEREVYIEVIDFGVGIENIEKAMEPMYTTRAELNRSGMGFAFMEAFMDELKVESEPGKGTHIFMKKILGEV
ncbi:MAG: anti-sigma F factor [Lachnospiraceae bacterium]|nr:anti-sigma F factor [Lachnospiraceae bacterium]